MGTSKLYRDNAYTMEFDAEVISQTETENGFEVVLDRTAFYPTGGGQPFDTGWIDGVPVIDVQEREDKIVHILKELPIQTVSGGLTGSGALTTCSSTQASTYCPPPLQR